MIPIERNILKNSFIKKELNRNVFNFYNKNHQILNQTWIKQVVKTQQLNHQKRLISNIYSSCQHSKKKPLQFQQNINFFTSFSFLSRLHKFDYSQSYHKLSYSKNQLHPYSEFKFVKRYLHYKADELLPKLLEGHRAALAKSITLVESKNFKHHQEAQKLLSELPTTNRSIRIGISGPPGVGKSSFIETFGEYLISLGLKLAVLAVDPSSTRTGGSILGDKTRMEILSRNPNAYIRPSPSAGFLGGVTANAYESISVCEAAGYDVVIVETVGVGQSETQVADLCDMVLLLVNPGSGDALQGIKRGIVEIADLIVVTKADGDLLPTARKTRAEYLNALRLIQGHGLEEKRCWETDVLLSSSISLNDSIIKIWESIENFRKVTNEAGAWQEKRLQQRRKWVWRQVTETVWTKLYHHPQAETFLNELQKRIDNGEVQPRIAVEEILNFFFKMYNNESK